MQERQKFWVLLDVGVTVAQLALDAMAIKIAKTPVSVEPERVERNFGGFGRTTG